MKTLKSYITERIETITDEATGETVEVWRPDEEEIQTVNQIISTPEEEAKAYKKYNKARNKVWDLEDEIGSIGIKIDTIRKQYRDLQKEMEETVYKLYSNGKDSEAENIANQYGEQLNGLQNKRNNLANKLPELENKLVKAKKQLNKILNEA